MDAAQLNLTLFCRGDSKGLLTAVRQWRTLVDAVHRDAVFTAALRRALDDPAYRALQLALVLRPEQGPVLVGSGGLRKLRWGTAGRGKRGGVRVIYYWDAPSETFFMLYLYAKNEQGDLTAVQLKVLRRIVEEEFR